MLSPRRIIFGAGIFFKKVIYCLEKPKSSFSDKAALKIIEKNRVLW